DDATYYHTCPQGMKTQGHEDPPALESSLSRGSPLPEHRTGWRLVYIKALRFFARRARRGAARQGKSNAAESRGQPGGYRALVPPRGTRRLTIPGEFAFRQLGELWVRRRRHFGWSMSRAPIGHVLVALVYAGGMVAACAADSGDPKKSGSLAESPGVDSGGVDTGGGSLDSSIPPPDPPFEPFDSGSSDDTGSPEEGGTTEASVEDS